MTDILLTDPQLRFVSSQDKNPALIGGLGCVRGDTKIHTENGLTRICDITSATRVLSWNETDRKFQLSLSGGSFPKGRANLYRVVTRQGEFVASGHHQILSSSGSYVQVQSLRCGDNILTSSFLQQTNLALDPLLCGVDVQHYSKTDEDCLVSYADEARLCGQQLLTDQESDLFYPQEQDGVHKSTRTFSHFSFLRGGALMVRILKHIRHGLSFFHICMMGCLLQFLELVGVLVNQKPTSFFVRTLHYPHTREQFPLMSSLHHSIEQRSFVYHSFLKSYNIGYLDSSTESTNIIGIHKLDNQEPYFDMQVLETNNYVCENGFIHHNSGKSRAGTMRLLSRRLQYPGSNGAYYMPTFDLLKLRALPGFVEDLEMLGIDYSVNKSDMRIDIHGYGFIILRSYDNPVRIVGYEVADSIVDEIDTLPVEKAREVWRKITERNRQKAKGLINTIGCVTTPDQGFNGLVYEKWGSNPQKGYHLIKAPTYSNPYLPRDYIDQIRANYDPDLAEMYIEGEFVNLNSDKVYKFFDREKHSTEEIITSRDYNLHVSIDFNVGGCCATVSKVNGESLIVLDEFVSNDTSDFINNLKFRYKDKRITVYPDASGGSESTNASASDIAMIQNAGFSVFQSKRNPFIRDRVNAVNSLFSHERFKININKCPRTAKALESQGYDKHGKPEKFNEHPSIDDWTDSLGYKVYRLFPVVKPQIKRGNLRA